MLHNCSVDSHLDTSYIGFVFPPCRRGVIKQNNWDLLDKLQQNEDDDFFLLKNILSRYWIIRMLALSLNTPCL